MPTLHSRRLCRSLALVSLLTLTCHAAPLVNAAEWKRHHVDEPSARGGADGVRLADVNGDGRRDITTGWEESGQIRVYLHPGPQKCRQSWPAVTAGKVAAPEDAVFADLDGDGAVDVVSSCEARTRTVFVHWAPREPRRYLDAAAWKTEPIAATAGWQSWMFALPIQIDGRGGLDLVVGSKGGGASISWLQSPDNPRDVAAWRLHRLRAAGWIMSLQAHDMDGDGDLDVLCSDRKGPARGVFWLENPGTKAAAAGTPWREHTIGSPGEAMFLARGDLDGDGRQDVVCAVKGAAFAWYRATGDPANPWQPHRIALPAGTGSAKAVALGDADGDGRADLFFTCENASGGKFGVRWLSRRGEPTSGKWQAHEISGPQGVKFDRIELWDIDEDGDLDLLTCEERDDLGVIWYENPRQPAR